MRIAVLEPAGHGGLLHYSAQLAEALAARGHTVELLVPRANELSGTLQHARMREVLPLPLRSTAPAAGRPAYLLRRTGVAARLVRAWARILWETRPGRCDAVLHGADVGVVPVALFTLAMTAVPGRPMLVRIAHNVRGFNRRGGEGLFDASPLGTALLGLIYARFDLVLVHGERSRAEFEREWKAKRVAVIPHGDERLFAGSPPPPSLEERVLFFGDWRKVKGLSVLMEAFDELVRRRPDARLTVAGTPAPEDWDPELVRAWARARADRVEVLDGYVPIAEVSAVFARARVVATPYLTGYQSGVIHLAATLGRAVVTSDVGDLGAAVRDGETGRVVPARDPVRLADALEAVLADPDLAARMGEAARRTVLDGSSWERVAERVEGELVRPASRPDACVIGSMDLVRPLGLAGIRSTVVVEPGDAAAYSRFTSDVIARGALDSLVERLLRHAASRATPPVLFYGEDATLLFVSRRRAELRGAYRFVIADSELVEDLTDKARFDALARRLGLPVPATVRVDAATRSAFDVDLRFPLVVKPVRHGHGDWAAVAGGKALRVDTGEQLRVLWPALARERLEVLLQELIPGPETRVESYHVYVDATGAVAGEFTGRKLRTAPAEFGETTALEITSTADVADLGRDLTSRLGLRGVAKFDFKRDDDGRLHLLEVNPRFNLWHHPGAKAGVNLPALVYADLAGLPRPPAGPARPGVRWVYHVHDARAARREGVGLGHWLAWAVRAEAKSVVAWDDPLPMVLGGAARVGARVGVGPRVRRS